MKSNISLAIAAFALTIFVFSPSEVFFGNTTQMKIGLGELLLTGLGIAAVVGSVVSIAARGLVRNTGGAGEARVAALFMGLALGALLQGTYLGWGFGALDGSRLNWSQPVILMVLGIAIWFVPIVAPQVIADLRTQGLVRAVSFIVIATQAALLAVNFATTDRFPAYKAYSPDRSGLMEFSSQRNIVLMVVDEFQCDVFSDVMARFPETTAVFDGFTHFENAVAPSSQTFPSVPALLTERVYDNSLPTPTFVEETFLSHSLPRALRKGGLRTELFQAINGTVFMSPEVADNAIPREFSVFLTYQVIKFGVVRSSPVWLKRLVFGFEARQQLKAREEDPNARNKVWFAKGRTHPWDMWSFRDRIGEATVADKPATFKFVHLEGTHVPIRFDEALEPVQVDYSRDSVVAQAAGVSLMISEYLETMKDLGIYDNALIFIVGDHGSGRAEDMWLRPDDPSDGAFNQIKARGCPLFLAKPIGASSDGIAVSSAPVALTDIPVSVLDALGLPPLSDGGASAPRPVFSISESDERIRRYSSYIWERFDALYLPPMQEFIIDGDVRDDAAWREGRVLESQF